MEWWVILVVVFGGLVLLLAAGVPVFIAFLLINVAGMAALHGGVGGFSQLVLSVYDSITKFTLLPIPLFILMGEVLWHANIARRCLDTLDSMMGRIPGRLSLISISGGAMFSALSGSTMATTAMLGSVLLPDMERRGYHKSVAIGPILASGGLAMIIPPSALAVIFAATANLSVAKILVAGILPGLLMSTLYASWILVRCWRNPSLAPAYETTKKSRLEIAGLVVKNIVPLIAVIASVVGTIILGIATPTEAAAFGCLGALILTLVYREARLSIFITALRETTTLTIMILAILTAATGFSQILAFSGATREFVFFLAGLAIAPFVVILLIQFSIFILGFFLEQIAIMLLTMPIIMPMIAILDIDPIWFGIIILINLQMALTTPPFGLLLFTMKGVAPVGTTMMDIYRSVIPFLVCDAIVIGAVMYFPALATYLPSLL